MSKLDLASPHIEALEPYLSARRIGGDGEVWLNANESPFSRQPVAMDVSQYHRYPDHGPDAVQAAYANYAGVDATQVLALRGADEAIDLLVRAYCRAGRDRILLSSPTYGMYATCAQIQNAAVLDVSLSDDFQLDGAGIRAADDPRLVFICNPNNPTGNAFDRDEICDLVEHFAGRALVVIDEAYIEFCPGETLLPLIARHEHLVIVRTLSKAFGLAGVHVGFLMAAPPVMDTMRKVVAPYPLADPCAQIALHALGEAGIAQMRDEVRHIAVTRDRFAMELAELNAVTEVRPSATNFVMARMRDVDGAWRALSDAGIVARRIAHPRLADVIRFSIGTPHDMRRVLSALSADEQGGGSVAATLP